MMNQVIRAPVRVRHAPRLRLAQVASVEQISPRMRRITLAGESLDGFTSAAADDHVKLFFPAPGQDRPVLPEMGTDGPVFPRRAVRPAVRDYTPRRFDAARRELVIEFVIHGDGPASVWAAQAAAAQWIGVGGPRGSLLASDDDDAYLLAGDEIALPAIARWLEEMRPGVTALALVEVADAREERHLPTAANAAVTWLHRDGRPPGTTTLLDDALRNLSMPRGVVQAWIAGEIETARRLRRHLLDEEGFPRARIRAAGYWRVGQVAVHAQLNDEDVVDH